ncbi:MAG: HAD family hydrolase [Nanoarchaeota archaeon]
MATKAVIFDCWGTLFYSGLSKGGWRRFAAAIGMDFDSDPVLMRALEKHMMLSRFRSEAEAVRVSAQRSGFALSDARIRRAVAVLKGGDRGLHAFRDALPALRRLKKRYALAILTNTTMSSFDALTSKYDLDRYFDVILTSFDVGLLKPDPAFFRLAAKRLGVSVKDVVMVGDSIASDMVGARNAGMRGILIDRKGAKQRYPVRVRSLAGLDALL